MHAARRVVDLETPAQGVQAGLRAGEAPPGQRHGIDRARGLDGGLAEPRQLGVQELEIELRVMDNQRRGADEFEKFLDDLREFGLSGQELRRQSVDRLCLRRHVALGVEVFLELPPARQAMQQLHAPDFDDPVTGVRVEAGGLGIEDDLTHGIFAAWGGRRWLANTGR